MGIERLIQLDQESPKRIAVVGDAMTDVYVHGHLEVGQEGCPKFVEESRIEVAGGALNAAQCLTHWHSQCEFFGQDTNVPIKTRFMLGDFCYFRHDQDDVDYNVSKRERELAALWDWEPDIVLISDYDKGALSDLAIQVLIREASDRSMRVVADAKRAPHRYAGTILKCNKHYAEAYPESLIGRPATIITDGAAAPKRPSTSMPHRGTPVQCVNHVGAGDCFAAHLALCLAHGLSLEDAAAIAHSAGRVYVQHPHNRAPHPDEVRGDMLWISQD